MYKKIIIVMLTISSIFSCGILLNYKKTYIRAIVEKDYSFFKFGHSVMFDRKPVFDYEIDPNSNVYIDFVFSKDNKWYMPNKYERDTSNMLQIHNAIKAIGYKNFISKNEYQRNMPLWENGSFEKRLNTFIKSYNNYSDTSNYYYKFWNRRKKEKNNRILYKILKEIQFIYNTETFNNNSEKGKENNTIVSLLRYDLMYNKSLYKDTTKYVLNYFNFLKQQKLEISAFNLIYHTDKFKKVKINRDFY